MIKLNEGQSLVIGTPVGFAVGAGAGAVFWGWFLSRFGVRFRTGAILGASAWAGGSLAGKRLKADPDSDGRIPVAVAVPLAVVNAPGLLAVGAAAAVAGDLVVSAATTLESSAAYAETHGGAL